MGERREMGKGGGVLVYRPGSRGRALSLQVGAFTTRFLKSHRQYPLYYTNIMDIDARSAGPPCIL